MIQNPFCDKRTLVKRDIENMKNVEECIIDKEFIEPDFNELGQLFDN